MMEHASLGLDAVFSLRPLIRTWEDIAEGRRRGNRRLAEGMLAELVTAPELRADEVTVEALERHGGLVDDLMSIIVPPGLDDRQMAAACVPFTFRVCYATPAFGRLVGADHVGGLMEGLFLDERRGYLRQVSMLLAVVERLYDVDIQFDRTFVMPLRDPATGRTRHFQFRACIDYIDVEPKQPVAPLTPEGEAELRRRLTDLDYLRALVPLDTFRMSGFLFIEINDVTRMEVLAQLRPLLMSQGALLEPASTARMEALLADLFELADLRMRLLGVEGGRFYGFNTGCHDIDKVLDGIECPYFQEMIAQVLASGNTDPCVIEDIATFEERDAILDALHAAGLRSALVTPLVLEGQPVGLLQLASTQVNAFDPLATLRLSEVVPSFALAVQRTFETLDMRVQAVIKQHFTSIHPSVEWRFREVALDYIHSGRSEAIDADEIVFADVYPLFGASDIRSSSTLRNHAIQCDLLEQLQLVRDVLEKAYTVSPLPYVGNLRWLVDQRMASIATELSSGDEIGIVDFLRRDIEPMFETMGKLGEAVAVDIERYRGSIDPKVGMLYKCRRAFDESVQQLNDDIAQYLQEQQVLAQVVTPHYFELHKTDGVDHNIYAGASIARGRRFDMFYLRNLRLWQLLTMCEVARRSHALAPKLPQPLHTAHLVLVQHVPLTIVFQADEKQFTVAGAYNIRYEIMKKRIDKAQIKGTQERITQPGMLAVIYSQPREADEYRSYLAYLAAEGQVEAEVDDYELEELPGVQGLRALRVAIRMEPPTHLPNLERAVQALGVLAGDAAMTLGPVVARPWPRRGEDETAEVAVPLHLTREEARQER